MMQVASAASRFAAPGAAVASCGGAAVAGGGSGWIDPALEADRAVQLLVSCGVPMLEEDLVAALQVTPPRLTT